MATINPSSSQHTLNLRHVSRLPHSSRRQEAPIFERDCISVLNIIRLIKTDVIHLESEPEYDEKILREPVKRKGKRKRSTKSHNIRAPARKKLKTVADENESSSVAVSNQIEVVKHIFELVPIVGSNNLPTANESTQSQLEITLYNEEQNLVDLLTQETSPIKIQGLDLAVSPVIGQVSLHAPTLASDKSLSANTFLLTLPTFPDNMDIAQLDFGSRESDLLATCCFLRRHQKVSIDCSLYINLLPPGGVEDASEVGFRLSVEIQVSLNFPSILEPITYAHQTGSYGEAQRRLLTYVFPPPTPLTSSIDIPFFYSVLEPAPHLPSKQIENFLQPSSLVPTLLPFQRRSTQKLLSFEHKTMSLDGSVILNESLNNDEVKPSMFWDLVKAFPLSNSGDQFESETWYFNRLTGSLSTKKPESISHVRGGLLAEEMGLGKTLECLALILLNPQSHRSPSTQRWDPVAKLNVGEVKTTLIVTPTSLQAQWVDEAKRHTPGLKVFVYEGWSKLKVPVTEADVERAKLNIPNQRRKRIRQGKSKAKSNKGIVAFIEESIDDDTNDDETTDWLNYVNRFDIVVTTFAILQHDLGVARAPVDRPRRSTAVGSYSNEVRPRSPLVMVEWARVIMDEVQLVGGGRAAEMMSLVPRLFSLAVSGTPAKRHVDDLVHVLKFLCVDEAITHPRHWKRILSSGFSWLFQDIFKNISIRTLKSNIQDELTIPSQKRYAIGITMGRVERHVYDEMLQQALSELGLDARGVAAYPGWELDVGMLRSWLRKLRAVATHPQVGQLVARDRILGGTGNLKSIGEVLETMRDRCWRTTMDARKAKVQGSIRLSQLLQKDTNNENRYKDARAMLLSIKDELSQMLECIREEQAAHQRKGDLLKISKAGRRAKSVETGGDGERETSSNDTNDDEGDESDGDAGSNENRPSKTPAEEDYRAKKNALLSRIRECQMVQHKAVFLLGDVFHVLGQASEEEDAYTEADALRKELLQATENGALRAMQRLSDLAQVRKYDPKKEMTLEPCGPGGLKSRALVEECNDILVLLNRQKDLLLEWRTHIMTLLTQRLSGSNETGDTDGQEYARALDTQGEVEEYIQAYYALLADRKEALVAERTVLAAHDVKVAKQRKTKAAVKATANVVEFDDLIPEEARVENQELLEQLMERRSRIHGSHSRRAVKSIMVNLNAIAVTIEDNKNPEKIIATREASKLRHLIMQQGQAMDKLENELTQFRKAFNERLLYFRQLQEMSDSVAEIEWEGSLEVANQECLAEIDKQRDEATTKESHLKFLDSLAADAPDEGGEQCVICTDIYENGWIFECAHRCCEMCSKLYVRKHRKCPVCRKPIDLNQAHRVINAQKMEQVDRPTVHSAPKPQVVEYNRMSPEQWVEIQTMDTVGSYGSKIQSIVRHLVWLQQTQPGSKSIVFSAWADSLKIIEHALKANGIPCLQAEQRQKKRDSAVKFRVDPDILVFLLHGERENTGLNLVEATRVFCIEPVVNHAFETQAIARIDRMGQRQETEVFCYYSEDTVERNILDLGVRQGFSLYTKNHAVGTLLNVGQTDSLASGKAIDSLKRGTKAKGDFVHSADDMLAILFPHLFDKPGFGTEEAIDFISDQLDEDVEMDKWQDIARQLRARGTEAWRTQLTPGERNPTTECDVPLAGTSGSSVDSR